MTDIAVIDIETKIDAAFIARDAVTDKLLFGDEIKAPENYGEDAKAKYIAKIVKARKKKLSLSPVTGRICGIGIGQLQVAMCVDPHGW